MQAVLSPLNMEIISGKMLRHNGESREEHLAEFLIVNPTALVHVHPESTALHIEGRQATILE
ncbi:dipeptidase E [Basfia succiniciproducens]|uniref:Dipeptidase E n=1 Tax=Basfia succiniciproducens TaxID=653940 RepID=A0A1G5EBH5_9PAST|nr:hypothetical protein A4G13_05225 [Basfia succiniciproducens]SCY24312.1 dipeptidase E [Basfia succiniciproducens]